MNQETQGRMFIMALFIHTPTGNNPTVHQKDDGWINDRTLDGIKLTAAFCTSEDASHKHNVEQKQPNTYVYCKIAFMQCSKPGKTNLSWDRGQVVTERGRKGASWSTDDVLFLDLGGGYRGVFTWHRFPVMIYGLLHNLYFI